MFRIFGFICIWKYIIDDANDDDDDDDEYNNEDDDTSATLYVFAACRQRVNHIERVTETEARAMGSPSLLLVLTSVLALVAAGSVSRSETVACPSAGDQPCRCWQTKEKLLQFDCSNLALTTAPAHLPTTTVVL